MMKKLFLILVVGIIVTIYSYYNLSDNQKGYYEKIVSNRIEEQDDVDKRTSKTKEFILRSTKEATSKRICLEDKASYETVVSSDWILHKNEEFKFSLSYPPGFGIVPNPNGLNIPHESTKSTISIYSIQTIPKAYDSRWGIYIYDNFQDSEITLNQVISEIGLQWYEDESRLEKCRKITLNGIPAFFVEIRTSKYSDWVSENIIFLTGNRIYHISNGVNDDPLFKEFYSSFKLM